MTIVIGMLVLCVLFLLSWNVVLAMDITAMGKRFDACVSDLWTSMGCKVNHTDYDAKEFIDLHHRDTLYTAARTMREDYEKSIKNITNLAKQLGYVWTVTDGKGNYVPGYWGKSKRSHTKKVVRSAIANSLKR